jgi:hypothetical protein
MVLVSVEPSGITVTFDLGEPFDVDVPPDWFTYGLAVGNRDGGLAKHLVARFSPTLTAASVFDFASSTQANYDGSHVDDRGSSVVVRFRDASLAVGAIGSLTGFATVEGEDVALDVPVQLLG